MRRPLRAAISPIAGRTGRRVSELPPGCSALTRRAAALPRAIHPAAVISESAQVHQNVHIGALAVIEDGATIGEGCEIHAHATVGRNVRIGANSKLHSGVQVLDNCVIGSRCTIQAGAIIGSDGFGFAPQAGDGYKKIPQTGNVILHDNCEVGAGTTIDRATLGSTIIEEGVKLDNQIQVAHNCTIGAHTVIAAQTGIAGSTVIGSRCMIGGQVGFAGHLKIADGVKIAANRGLRKASKSQTQFGKGRQQHPSKIIKNVKLPCAIYHVTASWIAWKILKKSSRIRAPLHDKKAENHSQIHLILWDWIAYRSTNNDDSASR